MNKAIVIVFDNDVYNSLFETLFWDLRSVNNVFFVYEKKFPEQGYFQYLPSRKIKKLTFGLSNKLYTFYYNLPAALHRLKKEYDHISVLLHNACLRRIRYPLELMIEMKKIATFNLLYLDVRSRLFVCDHANYLAEHSAFEKIFTIDPCDAQMYNMTLCNTPYSMKKQVHNIDVDNQIYYCGSDSGRMHILYSFWHEAKKRKISVKYNLSFADQFKDSFKGDENIIFDRFFPYEEVIKRVLESTCILDITQANQAALTVRPYEAVVYNKKLLTNNKRIFDFKYYDNKYMQYFDKIEDINWTWISEDVDVNYNYQGEFSPLNILKDLV